MSKHPPAAGFTLLEVLLTVFLTGIIVLSMAPLFAYATKSSASSADLATAGSQAVKRMEVLRSSSFGTLAAGGSLSSNVTSYFDNSDPKFTVRWIVTDNATPATRKTITVRAQAVRRAVGLQKEVQLTTVRSK